MKHIFFISAVFFMLTAPANSANGIQEKPFQIARTVKLGRMINATTSYQSLNHSARGTGAGLTEIVKPPEVFDCDANCRVCNNETGVCSACSQNRYISDSLCLLCPEKTYCDGETATPNCDGVACLANSNPEATNTGCCCMPAGCEGVACKSGYTPVPGAAGCCCT